MVPELHSELPDAEWWPALVANLAAGSRVDAAEEAYARLTTCSPLTTDWVYAARALAHPAVGADLPAAARAHVAHGLREVSVFSYVFF